MNIYKREGEVRHRHIGRQRKGNADKKGKRQTRTSN